MKKALLLLTGILTLKAATLVWDNNTETNLAGYIVYQNTGNISTNFDVGNTNRFPLTNLVAGSNYIFYVTAYNTDLIESDPSQSVPYTPVLGIPPMVEFTTNKLVKTANAHILQLAWKPLDLAYGVTNYQWAIYVENTLTSQGSVDTNYETFSLTKDTPIFIRIWATNIAGVSDVVIRPITKPENVKNPLIFLSQPPLPIK